MPADAIRTGEEGPRFRPILDLGRLRQVPRQRDEGELSGPPRRSQLYWPGRDRPARGEGEMAHRVSGERRANCLDNLFSFVMVILYIFLKKTAGCKFKYF